ncbi:MAG: amino acid adenylation domain-containing protein, partial [Gemmatimonadetes bacterium]|nr:amino acid adenylation domain-containing protein [Gemmatimonadota bacterium]
MRQVAQTVRESGRGTLPRLRRAFVGGDAVPPDLLAEMREVFPAAEVRVLYGPTEATIICASHHAAGGEVAGRHLVGRPLGNAPLYVLDPSGAPVPVGVPGELSIGGTGVARDYLGRPELTAEKFVPDVYSGVPGARLYRTGDRVRWGADGVLEFLGRTDTQVKIRGFRIEPGEIEALLAAHPGVRDAVVLVRQDTPGEKRLVGYVVPAEEEVSTEELRTYLKERVPEYMVPGALVVLEELPLTPNGKVDRKALPAPDGEAVEYVAPRTGTEEVVAGIWAEVLRRERVGATEDFFALGGHSLLATQVMSRVQQALGVEVPLRALFEAPTVAGLAAQVDALLGESPAGRGGLPAPMVQGRRGVAEGEGVPLSFAQQRLWFIDRLEPGSPSYNMPFPLRLRGALDVRALGRALAELVRRHESLRTVFTLVDGEPVQVIQPVGPRVLPTVDLSGLPEDAREAELGRLSAAESMRPFDLSRGPLLRSTLVRAGAEDHALLFTLHHIVGDAWSMGVLTGEVSALYAAFSAGRPSPLPEPGLQYADYAAWQREYLSGETLERQIGYWRERLAGAPPLLELPTDHPRPPVASERGANVSFVLPPEVTRGVHALARAEGATLFMTLLAGYQALLSRYSGQDDVVVGTPVAGRNRLETEGMIGFFVNTLVVRTGLGGAPGARALIGEVRERVLEAQAHQDLPFERLVDELHVERSLAHAPLFQALFNMADGGARAASPGAGTLGGVKMESMATASTSAKFDLNLAMSDAGEVLAGQLGYRTDLWDAATPTRMMEHLRVLLTGMAADPERPVAEIPLLLPAERERIAEWNAATRRDYPAALVHELFAAQARRTPDAVAIVHGGESPTYAELERRANRLANALRGLGVGPESRVGVCLRRTPELLVALLGVLKAGGAYVPLDPEYPAERLGWMLEDAGIRVVLTTSDLAGRLPEGAAGVLRLDAERERIAAASDAAPESGVAADNLSHVIFTSGSTGRPKGVMVRHGGVAVLLHWLRENVPDEERASVLGSTSVSFDVSVAEIFGTLCWGGTLVLVENALELPKVADRGIRLATMVPTAAAELLRTGGIPASVRAFNLGGEALPNDLAQSLYALGHVEHVRNLYGPTEDTTYSTFSRVERGGGGVRIGRPLANSRAYVLDGGLQPVPAGVVGELYLAGDGVARGYAGRPDLTAERFLPDPSGEPGARMYRTLDLARHRADGELEYLGRADFQVKLRGFRIELGEIESVLRAHPAVGDAVVVARDAASGVPGDRRLVAYVVAAAGEDPAGELRAHARSRLPEYMVPSAFVTLDAFPLTSSGKTDRRALPAPEGAAVERAYVAPRSETETALAGIWAEVLRVERVGVEDNFFDLGGHSLLATRMVARIQEALGVEVPLRALFETPTVAGIAERVEAERAREERRESAAEPGSADRIAQLSPEQRRVFQKLLRERVEARQRAQRIVRVPRNGPLPLSFAQQRLWFIQRMDPGSTAYSMPFPLRLRGPLDPAAMERALGELVRRHESLRTVFAEVEGEPVQVVRPAGGVPLPLADLRALPDDQRTGEVHRRVMEEVARPFDLARGPLFRALLMRIGDEEWGLVLNLHHIVSDGWSTSVLTREMAALYEAYSRGAESPLPELPIQYGDYAVWQRGWLTGERLDEQIAYWRTQLAGAPPALELPTDQPRPPVPGVQGASVRFTVPPAVAGGLRALARQEGATLFMVLLAGWQALLARYAGQDDVVVGSPIAGRTRTELEGLIGFFVNTLVLRLELSGDPTGRELLLRAREVTLGAFAHQHVPFEKLVEELQPERSLQHTPLFQVMFALQNNERADAEVGALGMESLFRMGESAKFDLSLTMSEEGEEIDGTLSYRAELWEESTIERMAGHLARLLAAVAADPGRRLSEVDVLGEAERRRVLAEWSTAEVPAALDVPVHERIAEQARRTPEAVAVRSGAEALTFAELEARANRLARALRRRGVGPEVPVGLFVERSAELVVGALGILKAGGTYVPIDPDYPHDRVAYILADSAVRVLLTRDELAGRLPEHGAEVLRLDADAAGIAAESTDAPESLTRPDTAGLAYVIYTSGSTGRPKGVRVEHRSLSNTLDVARQVFGFTEGDEMPSLASFAFDIWFFETLLPLMSGGTVRVVPRERVVDVAALVEELASATLLHAVPALMRQVAAGV